MDPTIAFSWIPSPATSSPSDIRSEFEAIVRPIKAHLDDSTIDYTGRWSRLRAYLEGLELKVSSNSSPRPYSSPSTRLQSDIQVLVSTSNPNTLANTYAALAAHPLFKEIVEECNPYQAIGRSIFADSPALLLADLDALFNIVIRYGGALFPHSEKGYEEKIESVNPSDPVDPGSTINMPGNTDVTLLYLDLGGASGGFIQYLQWRAPFSRGYGMSLKRGAKWRLTPPKVPNNASPEEKDEIEYQRRYYPIDPSAERFRVLWGDDGTGNIISNADGIIREMRQTHLEGLNIVMGSARPEITSASDYGILESLAIPLILSELKIALGILEKDGVFVLRIFGVEAEISIQLLYLITTCFDSVSLVKPMAVNPLIQDWYLVARRLQDDNLGTVRSLIENVLVIAASSTEPLASILASSSIPESFRNKLQSIIEKPLALSRAFLTGASRYGAVRTANPNLNGGVDLLIDRYIMEVLPLISGLQATSLWQIPGPIDRVNVGQTFYTS